MNANFNYSQTPPANSPLRAGARFAGNPDLIFLRENLADEAGAIVGYLECAREVKDRRLSRRFREVARDEEGHFTRLWQFIAGLDPVQAEELAGQDLSFMLAMGYEPQPRPGLQTAPAAGIQGMPGGSMPCRTCPQHPKYLSAEEGEEQSKKHYRPFERDLECLRNAIRDELHAINAYQKQIAAADNQAIQDLLIPIMNQEKEHVAEFTKLLWEILSYMDFSPKE